MFHRIVFSFSVVPLDLAPYIIVIQSLILTLNKLTSSCLEVFCETATLKILRKFLRKHPRLSIINDRLGAQGLIKRPVQISIQSWGKDFTVTAQLRVSVRVRLST